MGSSRGLCNGRTFLFGCSPLASTKSISPCAKYSTAKPHSQRTRAHLVATSIDVGKQKCTQNKEQQQHGDTNKRIWNYIIPHRLSDAFHSLYLWFYQNLFVLLRSIYRQHARKAHKPGKNESHFLLSVINLIKRLLLPTVDEEEILRAKTKRLKMSYKHREMVTK